MKKSKTTSPLWTREKEGELLFLLLGLSAGVYIPYLFGNILIILPFITSFLLLLLAYQGGKRRFLAFFFTFVLSLGISSFHFLIKESDQKGTFVGIVYERKDNYFLLSSSGKRYYVYEKENRREPGDILSIYGKKSDYEGTTYEGSFDFGHYLLSRGVKKSITAYTITAKFEMPLRMKEREQVFLSYFQDSAASLLDSFLFDSKDYEDPGISAASEIGALSFFSSSGIILGAMLRYLEKFLQKKCSDKKSLVFSSLPLLAFIFFSPTKLGFWRLALGRLFRLFLPPSSDGGPSPLLAHSLSGIFLCLIDYLSPLRSSFLVGVGLSIFIDLTSPILRSRFGGVKYRAVSRLSISIFLLPIFMSSSYFHLLSPLYSFFLLPLVIPFFSIGFLSFLTIPFITLLNGYGSFLSKTLIFLSRCDLAIPLVGERGVFLTYIFYVMLVAWHFFYDVGSVRGKRSIYLSILSFLVINSCPLGNGAFLSVSFINVGQGDAILIQDGFTSIMIDTGGSIKKDIGKEVDAPYLRKRRIYKLDYLIASHGDYDHIGASSSLSKEIPIAHYISEASSFPLKVGNLTFNNLNTYSGLDTNEQSLVLSLNIGDRYFLFTGDAPIEIEKKIIAKYKAIDCDVLKVGHHGSKTSSCKEFIKATSPIEGVISVGKKNSYGHPNEEVITILKEENVKIRRTDVEGTIVYRGLRGRKLKI